MFKTISERGDHLPAGLKKYRRQQIASNKNIEWGDDNKRKALVNMELMTFAIDTVASCHTCDFISAIGNEWVRTDGADRSIIYSCSEPNSLGLRYIYPNPINCSLSGIIIIEPLDLIWWNFACIIFSGN